MFPAILWPPLAAMPVDTDGSEGRAKLDTAVRVTPDSLLRSGIYSLTDHGYTAYLDVQRVRADTIDPDRFLRPGRKFSFAFDWAF